MHVIYIIFGGLVLFVKTSHESTLHFNFIRSTDGQTSEEVTYEVLCNQACHCGESRDPNFSETLSSQLANVERKISFSPRFQLKLIFCSNQKTKQLPKFEDSSVVTTGLNIIIFVNGMLRSLNSKDFEAIKDSIEYIDLSHNAISSVAGDSFKNLKHLQEIDLRFNNLAFLGGDVDPFIGLGTDAGFLPNIRLRGNPLECSCALEQIRNYKAILPTNDATSCFLLNDQSKEEWINIEVLQSVLSCSVQPHEEPRHKQVNNLKSSQRNFLHSEVTGFQLRQLSVEEKHHVVDSKLNISVPHEAEKHAHVVMRKGQPDYPLLLTMFVWFSMIYVGITRFIKTNDAERDSNTKYYMDIPIPEKQNVQ